jgi:glycosyltransferase involved in cell wall biosynthesis
MKIVLLAPFGIRPKGTVAARMVPLAVELERLGHDVVIVAPPYTNREDSGREELVAGIRLRNVVLPETRATALAAPLLAMRLYRAVLRENPDIVHLFKPKGYSGLAAQLLAMRHPGLPLFVDSDDWEGKAGMNKLHNYSLPERLLFDYQERRLPALALGVSVASKALWERMAGFGVAAERLLYLPNCAGTPPTGDGSLARRAMGIGADRQVILLYTRFFEFDQERLAWLCAELASRAPEACLLVVGKGRLGEEQQLQRAGELDGFAGQLFMAGWLEPGSIPDYLAAGDVAIYPFADTVVNRAKCPAKLTELLNAGLPVVAHRVGMIAEYISDGVSGVLCAADDWQAMADQVLSLLGDAGRRQQLGRQAREYLRQNFAWPEYAARLAEMYRRSSPAMNRAASHGRVTP